jgi:transposase
VIKCDCLDTEILIQTLIDRQKVLEQTNKLLLAKISELETELAIYKNKKDSGNSHKPPSTDIAPPKRNQSLREKSGNKPGGQPGHQGHTLKMSEHPDEIVDHTPCTCDKCGRDLSGVAEEMIEERQVVDIPIVKPHYKTHRVYRKQCSCGHITESPFPAGVNAPVQYGNNVEAMVAYLHARQYLPVARMAEMLEHLLGLPIGEGSIINIIARFAEKSEVVYEDIKNKVFEAACIGSDETSCKVNGRKNWFWTWQNALITLIVWAKSRGSITIEQTFPEGLPNAVLVSDRLSAQLGTIAKSHQVCLAHLLRDLNFIEQSYDCQWAKDFKTLIKDGFELDRKLLPEQYCLPNQQRDALELRLQQLLEQPLPVGHCKAITLQKQLKKIPGSILLFLHHADVPAHNNGSEKAIRNVKVKQKISGQFKSEEGAKAFAIIRSVIDTAIKSGKEVFEELSQIAHSNISRPAPA